MSIINNIKIIKDKIPNYVNLIAVSKTKSCDDIMQVYNTGHINFGENKVQELIKKQKVLPKDINWHMIGHLQRNKVKSIAPFIYLIHGVDSLRLLIEINKRAFENNRIIDCLIQINISNEKNKFGININDFKIIYNKASNFKNIKIKGIMGMATYSKNKNKIKEEFKKLNNLFNKFKNKELKILSMGMSNDYEIAIDEGSNMIRLGSSIFGSRENKL